MTTTILHNNALDPLLQQRVELHYYNYADALNRRDYARWPDFFDEQQCDYRVLSLENHDAGLPAPLMGCYSHGMVKDRVAMLIKGTLTYRRCHLRHYITNVRAQRASDGSIVATANLMVMQSSLEGDSSLYIVGRYEDRLVDRSGLLYVQQRWVIVDSFSIDNMLAVPL